MSRSPQVPWWRRLTSVRGKLVGLAAVVAALVGVVLVVTVQLVVAGSASEAAARVLTDRSEAVIRSATLASAPDRLVVPDADLDPGVVVYDDAGRPVAGSVPPSLKDAFAALSGAGAARTSRVGESYALRATPFAVGEGLDGVVVVAEPLAPYEHQEHAALAVSVTAAVLMVLLAAGATAWMSRRALAPVGQMARTAEDWSEHDLDQRFDLGDPTDEIRALGRTLDGLLEKVAVAIRAEQRLTAELAHELRTPLTTVMATTELIEMRADLDDQLREDVHSIRRACRAMSDTMAVLLDSARHQARSQAGSEGRSGRPASRSVGTRGADLSLALATHYALHRDQLDLRIPDALEVHAPLNVVTRSLMPVIDNALEVATTVTVIATAAHGTVRLTVCDDGPGIRDDIRARLFTPGISTHGSGLGLALARRIARSAGGDVEPAPGPPPGTEPAGTSGGATFVVTFPGSAR